MIIKVIYPGIRVEEKPVELNKNTKENHNKNLISDKD